MSNPVHNCLPGRRAHGNGKDVSNVLTTDDSHQPLTSDDARRGKFFNLYPGVDFSTTTEKGANKPPPNPKPRHLIVKPEPDRQDHKLPRPVPRERTTPQGVKVNETSNRQHQLPRYQMPLMHDPDKIVSRMRPRVPRKPKHLHGKGKTNSEAQAERPTRSSESGVSEVNLSLDDGRLDSVSSHGSLSQQWSSGSDILHNEVDTSISDSVCILSSHGGNTHRSDTRSQQDVGERGIDAGNHLSREEERRCAAERATIDNTDEQQLFHNRRKYSSGGTLPSIRIKRDIEVRGSQTLDWRSTDHSSNSHQALATDQLKYNRSHFRRRGRRAIKDKQHRGYQSTPDLTRHVDHPPEEPTATDPKDTTNLEGKGFRYFKRKAKKGNSSNRLPKPSVIGDLTGPRQDGPEPNHSGTLDSADDHGHYTDSSFDDYDYFSGDMDDKETDSGNDSVRKGSHCHMNPELANRSPYHRGNSSGDAFTDSVLDGRSESSIVESGYRTDNVSEYRVHEEALYQNYDELVLDPSVHTSSTKQDQQLNPTGQSTEYDTDDGTPEGSSDSETGDYQLVPMEEDGYHGGSEPEQNLANVGVASRGSDMQKEVQDVIYEEPPISWEVDVDPQTNPYLVIQDDDDSELNCDPTYDLPPLSTDRRKKSYEYTPVPVEGESQSSNSETRFHLDLAQDQKVDLGHQLSNLSLEQSIDSDDDASSVASEQSIGIASDGEGESPPRSIAKSRSGRYTQDGQHGAIFSPTMVIPEQGRWNYNDTCLSPGYEKKGPSLPLPMIRPPVSPKIEPEIPVRVTNEQIWTTEDEEIKPPVPLPKVKPRDNLPLYQIYDKGLKRKESLQLLGKVSVATRRKLLERIYSPGPAWSSEDSGGSSSSDKQAVIEPEPGEHNYEDWNIEPTDYGLIVEQDGTVTESIYEPLDYEDYLEEKRKKLFPLWRDQDRVVESGVLGTMTEKEQKLQEAYYEVITSEHSYLRSLNLVISHFLSSPLLRDTLHQQEHHILFSNIAKIRDASDRFLDELIAYQEISLTLELVPNILLNHLPYFDHYIHYCANNQHQISLYIDKLKKRPATMKVIHELEKNPDCQHLNLMSFLMLPFQRIARLPLLLKAVLDHAQSDVVENATEAVEALTKLARKCDKEADRMTQIKNNHELLTSLTFKDGVKHLELSQNAVVRKKGAISLLCRLGKKKYVAKPRILVITSEKVIIAKERVKGDQKRCEVQDWCPTNRVSTEEILEAEREERFRSSLPSGACCIFIMTFLVNNQKNTEEYILCTEAESDKKRWIQSLNTVSLGEMGERIYDAFDCPRVFCIKPYHPKDIDELRLDTMDQIDVLKKMDDGWWEGRRLRDDSVGWFPAKHVTEMETDHTEARRLKEAHYRSRLANGDYSIIS